MGRGGVLLDRDGTIIVDHGYVGTVDRVEFLDGAVEAIRALNDADLPVAVVTNQAGVARGRYEMADVEQVHKHMAAELARHGARVDLWLYCPYHEEGSVPAFARPSLDRKPNPGMALAAAEVLDLDLTASYVIGDRDCDIDLALRVGAQPLHVGTTVPPRPDVPWFADLATAVHHVRSAALRTRRTSFPRRLYPSAGGFGAEYFRELSTAVNSIDEDCLGRAERLLSSAFERDAQVFACGNGGSASIANHLQCDHVKGVRRGTGLRSRVISLSANMEIFSAIANDHGYDDVFAFQLESMARAGDLLVVISSSGNSPNIVRALEWARERGVDSIALTGFNGGLARSLATVSLHVDADNYGLVEDAHQACMHLLAQYVRHRRLPPAAIAEEVF